MSIPKLKTIISLEMTEDGVEVRLNGEANDIVTIISSSMLVEEKIEAIIMEASLRFMEMKLDMGNVKAIDIIEEIKGKAKSASNNTSPKSEHDFSGVKDLLTKEEKDQLL